MCIIRRVIKIQNSEECIIKKVLLSMRKRQVLRIDNSILAFETELLCYYFIIIIKNVKNLINY